MNAIPTGTIGIDFGLNSIPSATVGIGRYLKPTPKVLFDNTEKEFEMRVTE